MNHLTRITRYGLLSVAAVAILNSCTTEAEDIMTQDTKEAKVVNYAHGKAEYYVSGTGKPVILLHGAGASAQANWFATAPLLAETRRVINVNLVGAGNTTFDQETLSVDDLVALILAVADAEGANRFDVVSYSTGAVAALAMAVRHPQRVDQLIMMAPWAHSDARTASFFRLWERIYKVDPNLFAHFNTHLALSQNAQLQMNEEALSATIQTFENTGFNDDLAKVIDLLQRIDLEEQLAQITAETLVVGFEDDRIVPTAYAQSVAEGISEATYVSIAAGHGGPWEATQAMNTSIINFLK